MATKTDSQERLTYRYLLGDLPESEQLALEQEYFADNERQEQIAQLRTERSAQQQREREMEGQIATQRERSDQLAAELDRLREQQRAVAEQPSPPPQPVILSFLLTASVIRGSGGLQQLSIP